MDLKDTVPQKVYRDARRPVIASPSNNVWIGWRTGVNYKVGKKIRIDEDGYENFSDYFSSPEVEDAVSDDSSAKSNVTKTSANTRLTGAGRSRASIPSFFLTPLSADTENTISRTDGTLTSSSASSHSATNKTSEMVPVVSGAANAIDCSPTNVLQVISDNALSSSQNSPTPNCYGSRKMLRYSRTPLAVSQMQSPADCQKISNEIENESAVTDPKLPTSSKISELHENQSKQDSCEIIRRQASSACEVQDVVQLVGDVESDSDEIIMPTSDKTVENDVDASDDRMLVAYASKLKAALDKSTGHGLCDESCSKILEIVTGQESFVVPNESSQQTSASHQLTRSSTTRASGTSMLSLKHNSQTSEAAFTNEEAADSGDVRPMNLEKLIKDRAALVKDLPDNGESCNGIQKRKRNQMMKPSAEEVFHCEKRVTVDPSDGSNSVQETNSEGLKLVNSEETSMSNKSGRKSLASCEKSVAVYDLLPDDIDDKVSLTSNPRKTNKSIKEVVSRGKKISIENSSVSKRKTLSSKLSKTDVFKMPFEKRLSFGSTSEEVTIRGKRDRQKSAAGVENVPDSDKGEEVTGSNCRTVARVTPVSSPARATSKSVRRQNANTSSYRSVKDAMRSFVRDNLTDIATLPCTPEFLSSNIITSTPLPARQKSLRDKSVTFVRDMLISRTTLGDVGEGEESSVQFHCRPPPPYSVNPVAVAKPGSDAAMITNSQKTHKKRKRVKSILAFPKKRKPTRLSCEKKAAAGSLQTSDKPTTSNFDFSLAVDRTQNFTGLPRYSTASPLHYFEVTHGQSNHVEMPGVHKKIIIPKQTDCNLRRSKRTRVLTLEEHRGERIIYERRKSGFVIAGIESPNNKGTYGERLTKVINKHLRKEKRAKKSSVPRTPRNLSVHVPSDENEAPSAAAHIPEIPVLDRDINAEVLMECIKVRDQFNVVNLSGKPAADEDPLTLCKPLRHPCFSSGFLTIRGLQCKELQSVKQDTMVFCVIRGKVELTIHRTLQIVETNDMFCVPKGNNYSIRNLRKDEAKLFFVQVKN